MVNRMVLPNALEGRWVTLRGVCRDDYLTLYEWRSDVRSLHLWNLQRRVPPYEEFVAEFERMLPQSIVFLVGDKASSHPIGFAQAYNTSGFGGFTHVLLYFVEGARGSRRAGEAGLLFGDYLFGYFNFRKIYGDAFEYNLESIRALDNIGFEEEGRQREHIFYADRFWDLIRYSISREQWREVRDRYWRIMLIQEDYEELMRSKEQG